MNLDPSGRAGADVPPRYSLDAASPDGPDEMGRELAGGPAGVEATLVEVDRLRSELRDVVAAAPRVVLVGTGMSLAMALAAAPTWRRAALAAGRTRPGDRAAPVVVREATAAALGGLDGEAWLPGDLVVAISKSGTSPETLAAARHAATAGGTILAVTAESSSPLAGIARTVVATPIGDENGAGTKSGLAALAALLAIGGGLEADEPSRTVLARSLDSVVAGWPDAAGAGSRLASAGRTWIAGFGAGAGLAQAAAIMWHEKARRQAMSLSISELRHGPIEAIGPGDAVLVVDVDDPDPARESYLERLRGELEALGAYAVWLTPKRADRGRSAAGLLGTLIRLQQLVRATALAAGTYRDGFTVLRNVVQPATVE